MVENTTEEQISVYEAMITRQLRAEVSNAIYDFVHEHINTVVSDLAAEAVKQWAVQMQMGKQPGFEQKVNIQVHFVEEVINKVVQESNIKINVK